jgi:membrane glycosyltransferase
MFKFAEFCQHAHSFEGSPQGSAKVNGGTRTAHVVSVVAEDESEVYANLRGRRSTVPENGHQYLRDPPRLLSNIQPAHEGSVPASAATDG